MNSEPLNSAFGRAVHGLLVAVGAIEDGEEVTGTRLLKLVEDATQNPALMLNYMKAPEAVYLVLKEDKIGDRVGLTVSTNFDVSTYHGRKAENLSEVEKQLLMTFSKLTDAADVSALSTAAVSALPKKAVEVVELSRPVRFVVPHDDIRVGDNKELFAELMKSEQVELMVDFAEAVLPFVSFSEENMKVDSVTVEKGSVITGELKASAAIIKQYTPGGDDEQ